MDIAKQPFGSTPDGKCVDLCTLTNNSGLSARIITYGGIVVSLNVPDRLGRLADIVLGYDDLNGYLNDTAYFGATIGRYANRIARARFVLDGVEYRLAANNGPNHLHGGIKGFNKVVWEACPLKTDEGVGVKLTYLSRDGEEGYPGSLLCGVEYALTDKNELRIVYEAETDKPTVVNLTHHSYFNLAGHDAGDVLGQVLTLNADRYTVVDDALIPTGQIKPVKGTLLDFTKAAVIGSRIQQTAAGYDNNYVLNGGGLAFAARVYEPKSGRVMEVYTTEPGMQFYSGNFLDGSAKGKGAVYRKHAGFCLEAQHFPDSPNKPSFPSTALEPGRKYTQTTVYRFSVG